MKKPCYALLLLLSLSAAPSALAENCVSISDDQARLACYDTAAGRSAPGTPNTAESSLGWGADEDDTLDEEAVEPVNLAEEELLFGKRIAEEAELTGNAWVITPHHRNYLLPLTYADTLNREAWALQQPDEPMDRLEAKFQLSLKTIAWENILGRNNHLWVGYTQRNWWQVYNESSPFRGFTNTLWDVGFVHESNGQGGDLSRSWNRIVAGAAFERRRMTLNLRGWYRIPESSGSDDNPDIEDYLGYGDLTGIWKWEQHEFAVQVRNNLQADNRGSVQLEWTFPVNRRFKGYVQYFNGYGESLIDYNLHQSRIGFGVSMTDLL